VDSAASRELAQIKATIADVVRSDPGLNQMALVTAVRDRMAGMAGKPAGINKVRDAIRQMSERGDLRIQQSPKSSDSQRLEYRHYPK